MNSCTPVIGSPHHRPIMQLRRIILRLYSCRNAIARSVRSATNAGTEAKSAVTLLNQAPLGVYLVDADFRIREVNPVALPVLGEIPGGVIGRDFDEIIHVLWEKSYADEVVRIFPRTLDT